MKKESLKFQNTLPKNNMYHTLIHILVILWQASNSQSLYLL